MKLGTKIGLSFSFIGCAVGAYFGQFYLSFTRNYSLVFYLVKKQG